MQSRDDIQQGGLAASGRSNDTDELIFMDVEAYTIERDHLTIAPAVFFYNIVDLYFYWEIVSCHPVSLLSRNLTIFSNKIPITPITRIPIKTVDIS